MARAVVVRRPGDAALALRADGPPALPIELKLGNIVALLVARLPTPVGAQRTDEREPPLPPTLHEPVGLGVAGIDEVFRRWQVALEERLLNRLGHRNVGQGSRGGLDVGDEMRSVFVTGLR